MKIHSKIEKQASTHINGRFAVVMGTALVILAAAPPGLSAATGGDRKGEEVVTATCVACHGSGKDGAPKIGDKKAWGKLASRGLTNLTQSALVGIRKMPAHGGNADTSDAEISRAITYMINQSGGNWIEPIRKSTVMAKVVRQPERSGQAIVETQCGKCHQSGENGAPRVGDRDAWIQRLKRGLDDVVISALHGHGPMPARGGLADITVNEIRSAIIYMFNPASATMVVPAVVPTAPQNPHHRIIGSTEMFFGIVPAETIHTTQKGRDQTFGTDVPQGTDYYYISLSLRDRVTQVPLTNAKVEARIEDPAMRGESRTLDMVVINKGISYGAFFRLPTKGRYLISVTVERPDITPSAETRFEFTRS